MPKKLTQEYVNKYCLERGYRVISQYINANTKIKLQNIKTGIIGYMKFGNFQQGKRFDTKKGGINKLTYQEYIKHFIDESYTVLINEKDYKDITTETKINVMCPNNHQWGVRRRNFISLNHRCPMCNQDTGGMSIGEKLVYQLLQGNHITFEREKSVYIDGDRYSFDFYFEIEEFGYTDKFIIEYDGIQHYHDSSGYMSGRLKQRRASDEIKDRYARENNIQMIRIPWLNDTVDKVLFVINGETGLDFKKVQVDLPTIQEIADYYLTHSIKETSDEFSIGNGTVRNYFKQTHGVSKTEYLGAPRATSILKQEIGDYYLNHTSKETGDKFNICRDTLREYFKQMYGMNKKEYIGTSKQEEVADYYLSHEAQETVNKFNIDIRRVTAYFKQIYGVNKTEYTGVSKQKITDYYLTHSKKEIMDKFGISYTTLYKYFKNEYKMSKTEYLKTLDK